MTNNSIDCTEFITIDSPSSYGTYDMIGNVSEISVSDNSVFFEGGCF